MRVPCEQIQSWMTDYLAGELPAKETALVRTHVRDCRACQAELDGLGVTFIFLRGRFQAVMRNWAAVGEYERPAKDARMPRVRRVPVLGRIARAAGLAAAAGLTIIVSVTLADRAPESTVDGVSAGITAHSDTGEPAINDPRQAHSYHELGNDHTHPVEAGFVDTGFQEAFYCGRDDHWDDNAVTYVTPPAYGLGWRPGLEFL